MRAKGGNATLGELIGGAKDMSLKELPEILGEKMQDMPRNSVGRHRLIRSLSQRFGPGFRNIPGVKNIIKEFDDEIEFSRLKSKISSLKGDK